MEVKEDSRWRVRSMKALMWDSRTTAWACMKRRERRTWVASRSVGVGDVGGAVLGVSGLEGEYFGLEARGGGSS